MVKHTKIGTKERDKLIIDFIRSHDGCKSEEAFNGVKGSMSRQTFFKRLTVLRNNKSVKEDNPNKRDKGLHVNNGDLIVIISNELDQFEAAYFELLRKVLLELKKIASAPDETRVWYEDLHDTPAKNIVRRERLLCFALIFFKDMVNAYTYKLSIKWPFSISDRKHLERLQSMTLDRISKMYAKLYDMLKKSKVDDYIKLTKYFLVNIDESLALTMKDELSEETIRRQTNDFKLYGLGKEAHTMLTCKAFSYS